MRESAFVAPMEAVLDLYCQPYDARYPVICRDEQPKQLLSETRTPQPAQPGRPATCDYEYVRHGSPLAVAAGPVAHDRGLGAQAQALEPPRYRQAEYLTLVCDNPNTHTYVSFYDAFPPDEARRLAPRVRLVFTPRHGSWLHRAEPKLSVLTR